MNNKLPYNSYSKYCSQPWYIWTKQSQATYGSDYKEKEEEETFEAK